LQEDEAPIFCVSVADRHLERIFDRTLASSADSIDFWGIAADGGPIGSFLFYGAELYGLNWKHAR
jgi:hypothetical protein